MSGYDKRRLTRPEYDIYRAITHQTNPRIDRLHAPVHVPVVSSAEFKQRVRMILNGRGYIETGVRSPEKAVTGFDGATITFQWFPRPMAKNDTLWKRYGTVDTPIKAPRWLFAFYYREFRGRRSPEQEKPIVKMSNKEQSVEVWEKALRKAGYYGVAVMGQERLLSIAKGETYSTRNIGEATIKHIKHAYKAGKFNHCLPIDKRSHVHAE